MEMMKFDIDIAFELEEESFEELLARLGREVPSAYVRILSLNGPAAGWPHVEVIIPKADLEKFCEWYCWDDRSMWQEMILEDAKPL